MFFRFFEGTQFLAFLTNRYKNLARIKNGKTLSCFFKYSPKMFSQNFAVGKSGKRKFIPGLFIWYFFHYVYDRYAMRYYIQRYIKTF